MSDDNIGGVIIAVFCVFMIGLLLMAARNNNTVDVYTYKTVSGETGEANTCANYHGDLVCRTADGRIIRVESYVLKQREGE